MVEKLEVRLKRFEYKAHLPSAGVAEVKMVVMRDRNFF